MTILRNSTQPLFHFTLIVGVILMGLLSLFNKLLSVHCFEMSLKTEQGEAFLLI